MCPDNEKMKKRYEKFLIGAEEAAVSTVDQFLKAINMLDSCNNHLDFRKYGVDDILKFKEEIRSHKKNGKPVSPRTTRTFLLHSRRFLVWLCIQQGYRASKIIGLIPYLKPNKLEDNASASSSVIDAPNIPYVLQLCGSIKITCNIDLRDRALVAFLLLTGIRIGALISLPFGCLDLSSLIIDQNPDKKVKTKFNKPILSIVFPFDQTLVGYIKIYLDRLESLKFKPEDPLFPKTKIEYDSKTNLFVNPGTLSRDYWRWSMGVTQMLKRRCRDAGLKYYSPHKYRHGTALILYEAGLDASEVKAISQSYGHKKVTTTFENYGNYNNLELKNKLISLKFDGHKKGESQIETEIKEIKQLLKILTGNDS